jgi:hypothetical protein
MAFHLPYRLRGPTPLASRATADGGVARADTPSREPASATPPGLRRPIPPVAVVRSGLRLNPSASTLDSARSFSSISLNRPLEVRLAYKVALCAFTVSRLCDPRLDDDRILRLERRRVVVIALVK